MIYSHLFSKVFTLIIAFVFSTFAVFAQQMPPQMEVKEDFTDSELKEFVKVNVALIPIQESSQQKMAEAIQSTGLSLDRFQELAQAQQTGELSEAASSAEEAAKFNEAGQKVIAMQQSMQEDIQKVIIDSKLSEQEFQQIYTAYSQSSKVKEKVDEMMKKAFNP